MLISSEVMISSYNNMSGVKDAGFFCFLVFEFFQEFKYTRFVDSTVEPFSDTTERFIT